MLFVLSINCYCENRAKVTSDSFVTPDMSFVSCLPIVAVLVSQLVYQSEVGLLRGQTLIIVKI